MPEDDPLGQQDRYFYGWDAVDCTPCCGIDVTFSHAALLSVGGFTFGSITEDSSSFMRSATFFGGADDDSDETGNGSGIVECGSSVDEVQVPESY